MFAELKVAYANACCSISFKYPISLCLGLYHHLPRAREEDHNGAGLVLFKISAETAG